MMVWEHTSFAVWHHYRAFMSCVFVLGIVALSGCSPNKVTIRTSPQFAPSSVKTIALLPLKVLTAPQGPSLLPMESLGSPTEFPSEFRLPTPSMSADRTGGKLLEVSSSDAQTVTRLIDESLKNRPGIHIIPPDEAAQALSMTPSAFRALPVSEQVKAVKARLQVDGILTGMVRVYRERAGNKIAASGAVVGFDVHLIRPVDGVVLWTGEYYEQQKPLNEDVVGFFERGGTFSTADELAEYGVRKIMKQFPVGMSVIKK